MTSQRHGQLLSVRVRFSVDGRFIGHATHRLRQLNT